MHKVTSNRSGSIATTQMDITGKFIVAIVTGLVVLFAIAGVVTLSQQRNALDNLLETSGAVVVELSESNSRETRASEEAKIQRLVDILQKISAGPLVDIEIAVLEGYAKTLLKDHNMSYIGFKNTDGALLSSAGDFAAIDSNMLIKKTLRAEDMNVGELIVGYNFDRLNTLEQQVKNHQKESIAQMRESEGNALFRSIWSMVVIMLLMCAAVAGLVAIFFRVMVTKRLGELEVCMSSVAQGDLRQRVTIDSNDVIGRAGAHFNYFLDEVHNTITKVVAATGQLTSSSEQMNLITDESRGDISQQNSEIDLAATAINEMAATVLEVARNAATAADSAQNADKEAKNGLHVVTQAIDSINELASEVDRAADVIQKLEEDSNSIGVVLDVIRGIAEQTNLLALNAAIEAARAGEQGRGFAVVADEVRTLASRTQQSTEEIQQMIEQLQAGTGNAVKVMESGRSRAQKSVERAAEAGSSLGAITKSVAVISDMNIQIASAAEEQGSVAEEINRNIVSVHEIAKKTASSADKTASSSTELSDLATELGGLVNTFKV